MPSEMKIIKLEKHGKKLNLEENGFSDGNLEFSKFL